MYCPNCGANIHNDSLFCEVCGYSLSSKRNNISSVNVVSAPAKRSSPRHSSEEYIFEFNENHLQLKENTKSKKPLAIILLIIAILFAACSAFALLTGFGVIDNYFGLFETTTESVSEQTTDSQNLLETTTAETVSDGSASNTTSSGEAVS